MEIVSLIMTAIIIIAFFVFIGPALNFALGYVTGIFAKITIGNSIVAGLALLGIHISVGSIPLLFGVINVIASFFSRFTWKSSDD